MYTRKFCGTQRVYKQRIDQNQAKINQIKTRMYKVQLAVACLSAATTAIEIGSASYSHQLEAIDGLKSVTDSALNTALS